MITKLDRQRRGRKSSLYIHVKMTAGRDGVLPREDPASKKVSG